jgi:hypothetical protein
MDVSPAAMTGTKQGRTLNTRSKANALDAGNQPS